jgi:hypothetical protein
MFVREFWTREVGINLLAFGLPTVLLLVVAQVLLIFIRGDVRNVARLLLFKNLSNGEFATWSSLITPGLGVLLLAPFGTLYAWGATALTKFPHMYGYALILLGTSVLFTMFALTRWRFNGYRHTAYTTVLLSAAVALVVAFQLLCVFLADDISFVGISITFLVLNMIPVGYIASHLMRLRVSTRVFDDLSATHASLPALLASCWDDIAAQTHQGLVTAVLPSGAPALALQRRRRRRRSQRRRFSRGHLGGPVAAAPGLAAQPPSHHRGRRVVGAGHRRGGLLNRRRQRRRRRRDRRGHRSPV